MGWSPFSLVRWGPHEGREAVDGFPHACIPHLLVGKTYGLTTEDLEPLKVTVSYDLPPSGFIESGRLSW